MFDVNGCQVVLQETVSKHHDAKLFLTVKYQKHFFYSFIEMDSAEAYREAYQTFNQKNAEDFLNFAIEEYKNLPSATKGH